MSKVETDHDCKSDNVSTCRVCAFRENFELIKKITNETTKDLPMTGQMREFWIDTEGLSQLEFNHGDVFDVAIAADPYTTVFYTKFIEYSAYQALQAELAEAKAKLLVFQGMTFSENQEIAELRAKLAEAVDYLEGIVFGEPKERYTRFPAAEKFLNDYNKTATQGAP